ncbi:MAG: amidohydrolase/deacetylase family metallohydrolase, partial [Candidatus Latescibacteria bacterium]|nr:amidohydrolase/deacetylase family metallohydrolase [Candidatus Latescibacterota bacterium]
MDFDLLIAGGHLIDPANGLDGVRDVAVSDGRIAAVDVDIPATSAGRRIDADGLYITPGLVDIHVHLYATAGNEGAWGGDNSILPD